LSVEEWIRSHFKLDRDAIEILIPVDYYVVGVLITEFTRMFGEAIQNALNSETDVISAIKASDPNNELGYNDLITDK